MTPSAPDVSVVISTYNYRAFIAEAIDSALAQTCPPREVLVIDDGSGDGTSEFLAQRYSDQATVQVFQRENRGQLACFIEGVRRARGEVVAFLDADDRWQPSYLERILAIYTARPAVDFVYTNMRLFGSREGNFLRDDRSRDLGLAILSGAYSPLWQASATSALSLRRSLADALLLDIPDRVLPDWKTRADDWLAYGSDVLGGRKYYLAESLVDYRAHGSNSWLAQDGDSAAALRQSLKVEAMVAWYRGRAGGFLDTSKASALRYLKHEFRTKERPSLRELLHYSRLLGESAFDWGKRLEHRAAMWRHYLRTR